MNKRRRPGRVLNALKKSIKKNKVHCINLIFTIFKDPVDVNKEQLRLFIRERCTSDYIYGDFDEIVIDTTYSPPRLTLIVERRGHWITLGSR